MIERLCDRIARTDGLIVSIHIPKTAGSRFLGVLRARFGKAVAVHYGENDKRTHPAARRRPSAFDADMVRDLEGDGVKILHGHFRVAHMTGAVADPSRYMVWVREPVERTISHYHFLRKRGATGNPLGNALAESEETVEDFAHRPQIGTFQSRYVRGLPLREFGFVGTSELFVPLMAHEGLQDAPAAAGRNADKPLADGALRRTLVPHLSDDVALYSEAMALTVQRMQQETAGGGLARRLKRLMPVS